MVITVLAVLATIVLIAVNPGEQLARGRDANRISAVTSVGRSIQRYYSIQGAYPNSVAASNWMQKIIDLSELKLPIGNPAYSGSLPSEICNGSRAQNLPAGLNGSNTYGYCYAVGSSPFDTAIVYVQLESNIYNKKCFSGGTQYRAWAVWASAFAKSGLWCSTATTNPAAEPTIAGVTSLLSF